MYDNFFSSRLASLRSEKGISARDMSLSIGQNPGYINYIENGKALPSMSGFFYICEYLDISPSEFFDGENKAPEEIRLLMQDLKKLSPKELESIAFLVQTLAEKK